MALQRREDRAKRRVRRAGANRRNGAAGQSPDADVRAQRREPCAALVAGAAHDKTALLEDSTRAHWQDAVLMPQGQCSFAPSAGAASEVRRPQRGAAVPAASAYKRDELEYCRTTF